jgi:hypothetical protein
MSVRSHDLIIMDNSIAIDTTDWIDSLKIHLLHPYMTIADAHIFVQQEDRPCAIERSINITLSNYQKGVMIPILDGISALIDLTIEHQSHENLQDVSLCWIANRQAHYPHNQKQQYLDWMPGSSIAKGHIGIIRTRPSIEIRQLTLHYKELYLSKSLSQSSHAKEIIDCGQSTHISNFHVVASSGQVQSCWSDSTQCPDSDQIQQYHHPTIIGHSMKTVCEPDQTSEFDLNTTDEVTESEYLLDEFITI